MFNCIVSEVAHTQKVLNTIELCGSWSWLDRTCLLRLRYVIVQIEMQKLPCFTVTLNSRTCATFAVSCFIITVARKCIQIKEVMELIYSLGFLL
jgi:hypothetical protein